MQGGGSLWGGWRARVEELGCGDRVVLELPCSQDSQLGKKEAACIALCTGFLYVWPKIACLTQKNPCTMYFWKLEESTLRQDCEVFVLVFCSPFHLMVTAEAGMVGDNSHVVSSRVLLLCSSKTKS